MSGIDRAMERIEASLANLQRVTEDLAKTVEEIEHKHKSKRNGGSAIGSALDKAFNRMGIK